MAPPMRSAAAVVAWFEANDGMGEYPDGSNRNAVTEWTGWPAAWCIMALSRALWAAGYNDGERLVVPGVATTHWFGWAYTPAIARCFADAGLYGNEPRYGSLGIVVYPSSGRWVDDTWRMPGDHGCLVVAVCDASGAIIPWDDQGRPSRPQDVAQVVTWDGNISNRIGMHRRSRSMFHGFGYPPYDPSGGFLMALSDAEQDELRDRVRDLHDYVSSVRKGDFGGPNHDGVEVETRDLVRELVAGGGGGADPEAIAAAVVAAIGPGLAAEVVKALGDALAGAKR